VIRSKGSSEIKEKFMKTKNVLSTGLILSLMITGTMAIAQGRGHDRGHEDRRGHGNGNGQNHDNHDNQNQNGHHQNNGHNNNHDGHYQDNHQSHEHYSYHHGDNYHRRENPVVYVYNSRPIERRVVINHYHRDRPRYVYYSDYDVYYDYSRNVYISFTGRGWTISTVVPVTMYYADRRTIVSRNVDYYDDDFTDYLGTRRPGGRHCDDW
jgi:hypothetical protein